MYKAIQVSTSRISDSYQQICIKNTNLIFIKVHSYLPLKFLLVLFK